MTRALSSGAAASKPRATSSGAELSDSYLRRSERPLTSLVFLLPLIILYELGVWLRWTGPSTGAVQQIKAFTLMQQFFGLFGAEGQHLPALAVVSILLAWHIARNDSWKVHVPTLLGMAVESAVLAVPLVALGIALTHWFSHASLMGLMAKRPGTGSILVLSLGAGVYEELVFRLGVCTLLSLFLRDMLHVPKITAYVILVLTSALLFAAYHHFGTEAFSWRNFSYRTVAGIYLGGLFLTRGFGVTAASHTACDLFILML